MYLIICIIINNIYTFKPCMHLHNAYDKDRVYTLMHYIIGTIIASNQIHSISNKITRDSNIKDKCNCNITTFYSLSFLL